MNRFSITLITLAIVGCCCSDARSQTLSSQLKREGSVVLARDARTKGDAVRGAILFPQRKLGCAACHTANSKNAIGPNLRRLGKEATDVYLIESLIEPSKVIKKDFASTAIRTARGTVHVGRIVSQTPAQIVLFEGGATGKRVQFATAAIEQMKPSTTSAMPDNLVDQLASRQEFLDLAKYVMELAGSDTSDEKAARGGVTGGGIVSEELRGLALLDELGCITCHRQANSPHQIPPKRAPNLAFASSHVSPHHIAAFIADPQHVKPGTTMPTMLGSFHKDDRDAVTNELTHYIVSMSKKSFTRQPLDDAAAIRGRELFHAVGCVACHSPRDEKNVEQTIDDSVPLGKIADKYNIVGLTAFLENPHAVRPSGRMPNMQLTHWEAGDLAQFLLSRPPNSDVDEIAFQVDNDQAAKGKRRFVELGCVQCHANAEPTLKTDYLSLAELESDRGCLSDEEGAWPRYTLTNEQRTAFQTALKRKSKPLSTDEQIQLTLHTCRCLNCHQRDALGGVSVERDAFLQTTNPNLGPQGRIPPTLTNVGAKLNPKWLRQVVVSGRAIRPYMKTRMPQHGADNIGHLVALLSEADDLPDVEHGQFTDQKKMREAGHKLAGTEGLNCIACHTFQLKPALTMPAVDLTEMSERLRKDWFYHYMRDPQRLSPNTVMPTFYPGGRAMRADVLDGDRDLQIEALWQWMLDGRQAREPRGLRREPMELVAADEAVMLRRAYRGIGKRGIGVGYPQQVNIAFDAEQMRLGLLWKGKFADPAGVWLSQGHGTVNPLSRDVLQMPKGPDVDDAENPWVVDEGRPPKHRFMGYSLDEKRRPILKYRFEDVVVTDYFVDEKATDSDNVILRRTLTLTSSQPRNDIAVRIGAGKSIERVATGQFVVDGKLKIRLLSDDDAAIVGGGETKTLKTTFDLPRGTKTIKIETSW